MENKKFIIGLQNCSQGLMSMVDIVSSEQLSGQHHYTPCDIFNFIKYILVGGSSEPVWMPVSNEQLVERGISVGNGYGGILDHLCEELKETISYVDNNKLRKQLVRALELCKCLSQTLETISCIDCAFHLVGKLFCLLLEIILAIVSIIVKIILLIVICDEKCTSDKVRGSFCDCVICELEKELDDVEELIEELTNIAIAFIRFASKDCKCKDSWGCKDHCECKDHCKCKDDWDYEDDCDYNEDWECKCDWKKNPGFKCKKD